MQDLWRYQRSDVSYSPVTYSSELLMRRHLGRLNGRWENESNRALKADLSQNKISDFIDNIGAFVRLSPVAHSSVFPIGTEWHLFKMQQAWVCTTITGIYHHCSELFEEGSILSKPTNLVYGDLTRVLLYRRGCGGQYTAIWR